MGTYKPGVFGPFNGRVGDVVAAKWKDVNVVKNRPAKSKKPATTTQIDQRARFGLGTTFAGKAADMIAIGFRGMTGNVTPTNIVAKQLLKDCITGTYPDYVLDYPNISLSKDGNLDLGSKLSVQVLPEFKQYKSKIGARAKAFKLNYHTAVTGTFPHLSINYKELQLSTGNASDLYNLKMEDKGGGLFGLTWKSCGCNRSQDDMLVLVLYEETQNSVAYTMELANVSRQQAEFVVCDRIGCKVHVYVFTVGKKKGGNSESQYLGLVA